MRQGEAWREACGRVMASGGLDGEHTKFGRGLEDPALLHGREIKRKI